MPQVTLLKQIKSDDKWKPTPPSFDSKGLVRRGHVRVAGGDEVHPEVSYFAWWEEGRRVKPPVPTPSSRRRRRAPNKAELSAIRSGVIAPPEPEEAAPARVTVSSMMVYLKGVRNRDIQAAEQRKPRRRLRDRTNHSGSCFLSHIDNSSKNIKTGLDRMGRYSETQTPDRVGCIGQRNRD